VAYLFEWDTRKGAANAKKHGVTFEEACTVFADPLAILMPDPDHSMAEQRYVLLGTSSRNRLLVVAHAERPPRSSRRGEQHRRSDKRMKKRPRPERRDPDRDTMRVAYDFSKGKRGITAAKYAEGSNVVVIDPDVLDVFPDGASINDALRALAPVIRQRRTRRPPNKPMQRTAGGAGRR
jgi:uncharacterized protein